MSEKEAPRSEFDFDRSVEALKRAAAEFAKPEVQKSLRMIGEAAEVLSAIQDAVKAVAIQDAVKAVAIQDAVKAVAIQDALKVVHDPVKAVAIQDAVKAVVGGMAAQDWSTPDAADRLTKILEAIRSASAVADKRKK